MSLRLCLLSLCAAFALLLPMHTRAAGAAPHFAARSIVLLQPEGRIGARVGAEALASYIKAVSSACEAVVFAQPAGTPTTGALILAIRTGGRSRLWLEFGENPVPTGLLEPLRARIAAIPAPQISDGTVSFQLNIDLWGGAPSPTAQDDPALVPEQWREAAGRLGGAADTETLLDEVWPEE